MLTSVIVVGILILVFGGLKIVPQQQVWVSERFGKFHRRLEAGLNFIIPIIDRVAYKHTLKERAVDVTEQTVITKDNVTLVVDGIIYIKITDPVNASYGVENPYYAVTQLAQTSMRSAIGKITMDTTFEEREYLNSQIVMAINEAAESWGIQCMRYELRDIKPPTGVLKAMEMQVAAERQKRAVILESEGTKQSVINRAEGEQRSVILASEASMTEKVNRARGEAEAIELVAKATATSIALLASAIAEKHADKAVALRVAEQYVNAFAALAKTGTTLIVPETVSDVGGMVGQALAIFKKLGSGSDD